MSKITQVLAKNLKRLRDGRNLTQEDLAEKAGLSLGQVKYVETGRSWVSLASLSALAEALGCNEMELFRQESSDYKPTPKEAMEVIIESMKLEGKVKPREKTEKEALLDELLDLASTLKEGQLRHQVDLIKAYLGYPKPKGSASLQEPLKPSRRRA